jgi:hypothetical protein
MQFPFLPEQSVCLSVVCLLVLLYTSQSVRGSLGNSTYFAQDKSEVQIGKGLDVTMHTSQVGDQAGLQPRPPSSSSFFFFFFPFFFLVFQDRVSLCREAVLNLTL